MGEWDRVLALAKGIWGLANDGLDGPGDREFVKENAEHIVAIAEEQGAVFDRPSDVQTPRRRPFPGDAEGGHRES